MSRQFFYALAIAGVFVACKNNANKDSIHFDADSVKKIILDINNQMLAARNDSLQGPKKWISFCADSIIAGYDQDFTTSPVAVAHDLGDGISEQPHQYTFLLYDKTAILSYLFTSYELFNGDTLFHHLRATETFAYVDGKWKLIGLFDALQPVNYFSRVMDKHASMYKKYAGLYQWKKNLFDSLFVKDGKLYSVVGGEEPEENFPVNDSEYMTKDDFGRVKFNMDRNGKVISYTYTKHDGQKVKAIKIK